MMCDYLKVLSPVIGLMLNVVVQVSSFRCISRMGLLRSVFAGFGGGVLSVLLLHWYLYYGVTVAAKECIAMLLANLIIYAALGYCYFHFINLGETARRIRILREIYCSQEGLSLPEILDRYNYKEIVEKRMNRLLNNGQVIDKEGRYFIGNPAMLLMARSIVAAKLVLLGKKSEFA